MWISRGAPRSRLGPAWISARAIDPDPCITHKCPWLDQNALPVALAKLVLSADGLDERYNYPAHIKSLNPDELPYFCHYHSPDVIRREPLVRSLVNALANEHPSLRALLEADAAWRSHCNCARSPCLEAGN